MAIDQAQPHDQVAAQRWQRFGHALISEWLPALDGVQAKLQAGTRAAEICCGHAMPTIVLAQTFPHSFFFGYDQDDDSILAARQAAARAGVLQRTYFQHATPVDFPGWNYHLVTLFGRLAELVDPLGSARRVKSALAPGGVWMVVEPGADEGVIDKWKSPVAGDGARLGASGQDRAREIARAAGFSRFRCICETPFHRVLETRS